MTSMILFKITIRFGFIQIYAMENIILSLATRALMLWMYTFCISKHKCNAIIIIMGFIK